MTNIQGISLQYFICMCIGQASSISTTCKNHHVFMVSFLSEVNYSGLTMFKAFWKSMLHCFRHTVQFTQICPRTYSIKLARCLRSIFLAFAMFMKLLFKWLAAITVLWYVRYVRYGFKISWKHQRLVFVFSLLVKLIWFREIAKLSMPVLSNFKRINSYQLYLHCCMEANHMFRNAFSFEPY